MPANTLLVISNCYGCPHKDWHNRKQVCGKINNVLTEKMLDEEPPSWCPLQLLHPVRAKVLQCPYGHGPVDARSLYCCRRCGWDANFKG